MRHTNVLTTTAATLALLCACQQAPRDDERLTSQQQSQKFTGWVSVPNAPVKLQVRSFNESCMGGNFCICEPGPWVDWTTIEGGGSPWWGPDDCGENWYMYDQSVQLPTAERYWCQDLVSRVRYQEWRTTVYGIPVATFDEDQQCNPSRRCQGTVVSECNGSTDGIARLNCWFLEQCEWL